MSETAATRLAAICAMLFGPLLLVGFGVIVGFSPTMDEPAGDVARYYRSLGFGRALFGEWLELLAFIAFLVFAARIAYLVRNSPSAWLGSLELSAAAASAAVAFLGVAPLIAAAHIGANAGTGVEQFVLLNTLRNASHWISSMLLGLWMVATAALTISTRMFPAPAGWAGAAIGIILLAAPAAPPLLAGVDVGQMLFLVWLMVIGVMLLARRARAANIRPEET